MGYLFSLHTWELNFGQTICHRTEVLLGISYGDNLRTWENPMGTHWEQGEKPKYKPPPPSTPPSIFKRKKSGPLHECIQNLYIMRDLPQQKNPRALCWQSSPNFICSHVPMEIFYFLQNEIIETRK
jgi:hypothetical protein